VTTTSPTPMDILARDHAAAAFRFLRSLVGDGETARDLLQDTFVRLAPHAANAGPGLVFATARSCAVDHLRSRRTRGRFERRIEREVVEARPAPTELGPDRALEDREFQRDLLVALAALPEDQRTVFHLSEVEGRSYAEIAEVLGVPAGTIASRKHHAVRKLREQLRRLGHES
jgi:RNA polymerase sigma-70 factor, ECF subfamily